jgi:hypothetical protein
MLDLDFSPKQQKVDRKGKEVIYFYILFVLFLGMSLLYFRETRRAGKMIHKQEEILKTIHERLEEHASEDRTLSPYFFRFRGVVGNDRNVYILLEDQMNKTYLVENGDILLSWEISYIGGDSLILKSIETGEKILLKMGKGP